MIINSILSFEFPPINELLRWRDVVPGLNKVGLIAIASALIGTLIFLSAARKDPKVAPNRLAVCAPPHRRGAGRCPAGRPAARPGRHLAQPPCHGRSAPG